MTLRKLLSKFHFPAIVLALICSWGAFAREFRAADNQVADYPTVQAIEHMNKLLVERTGGRHSVKVFHSAQLGEEDETIAQTRSGAIDINRINAAPLTQLVPDLGVLTIPFLFKSIDHQHRVLDGQVGEEILARLESYGFVGLAFYDSGARSLYTTTPVRSLVDLKSLRIRVQQSELAEKMVRAMGATPVVISYGQVLTSLTSKLVDGAENNWPSYVTTNHFKAAKYYILTEHTMAPELLLMSKPAWDSLDVADRRIVKIAAMDSAMYMRTQWQAWEERSRQLAISEGITVVSEFDRQPFVDAMASIHTAAEADPRIGRMMKLIREVP